MGRMDTSLLRSILHTAQPLYLISGFLSYTLGLGIAYYLGTPLNWLIAFLGAAWVFVFQLGMHFLAAYFHPPRHLETPSRFQNEDDGENLPVPRLRRDRFLWAAFAAFAALTSLLLLLMQLLSSSSPALFVMGLSVLGAFFFAVPPYQWINRGYGELMLAIVIANFFPALAFLLQVGALHRLVAMSTFPLTLLFLALLLAYQLPDYLQDLRQGRRNLMVRLGWERGMVFHNVLILSAYLLIGVAIVFGMPLSIGLPTFFVLPLGLFQVWYMTRIAAGAKPNWRALTMTASLTFGLTAYLLAFAYWAP